MHITLPPLFFSHLIWLKQGLVELPSRSSERTMGSVAAVAEERDKGCLPRLLQSWRPFELRLRSIAHVYRQGEETSQTCAYAYSLKEDSKRRYDTIGKEIVYTYQEQWFEPRDELYIVRKGGPVPLLKVYRRGKGGGREEAGEVRLKLRGYCLRVRVEGGERGGERGGGRGRERGGRRER
uniref:Uncharacterized protein n=1 Tax=Palpitomonas bilix TaxID=652834 RepID=A0A7S3DG89_9EUKA|mmetsp:Transcript_36236/g.94253  ORF Transcript_36236/g.94253 Transcript_36236/m.94253 type:complete len:180 (+) Transcript_36236:208-747(+)